MFSGGNWQNVSYGVSYALADDLSRPDEWEQHADGQKVLPILRTMPGVIVGPGHNSVVRGPNGRELYCVYHRWTDAGRVVAIDRMDVVGRRIYVVGATNTPQPAPFRPREVSEDLPSSCLIEFSADGEGELELVAKDRASLLKVRTEPAREYRLEIDGRWHSVTADGWERISEGYLDKAPAGLASSGDNSHARMTPGFEDLFDRGEIGKSDWRIIPGTICEERDKQLFLTAGEADGGIGRQQVFDMVEVVVNARLDAVDAASAFGIALYDAEGEQVLSMLVSPDGVDVIGDTEAAFPLPTGWDLAEYHAYRLFTRAGKAAIYLEQHLLGEIDIPPGGYCVAVLCRNTTAALDMVRVTGI